MKSWLNLNFYENARAIWQQIIVCLFLILAAITQKYIYLRLIKQYNMFIMLSISAEANKRYKQMSLSETLILF